MKKKEIKTEFIPNKNEKLYNCNIYSFQHAVLVILKLNSLFLNILPFC